MANAAANDIEANTPDRPIGSNEAGSRRPTADVQFCAAEIELPPK
jgi:hypothetical protein